VDEKGNALTYNGSSWSAPTNIDGTNALLSVSCASSSFCVTVDEKGNALTYNGSSWSAPTDIDGTRFLSSVSCPSSSFCVAVDSYNDALTYSGSTSPAAPANTSPPTISGTAEQGQALTEQHGSWTNEPTGYAYQWEGCDSAGNNCTAITDATGQSYTLAAADVGHTIRVQETASNASGKSSPAVSAATAVVQAPSSGGTGSEGGGGAGGGGGVATTASTPPVSITPSGSGPTPIFGQRQTASLISGTVTVRLKGTTKFVSLSGTSTIPDGSEVEATNGHVLITVATLTPGKTQSAEVWGGRFLIHQERTGSGETHFILSLPLTGCPRVVLPRGAAAALAAVAKHSSGPKSRHLWVSEGGGSWGTNGRYVSTTVEGTRWLTLDECDRSEVRVAAGRVKVHDLIHNKTKILTAGKTYVAARGPSKRLR
jgi:hypothetical protein